MKGIQSHFLRCKDLVFWWIFRGGKIREIRIIWDFRLKGGELSESFFVLNSPEGHREYLGGKSGILLPVLEKKSVGNEMKWEKEGKYSGTYREVQRGDELAHLT